ncbi:MAG: PAS domain-containing sensor histidine kinase [Proteobacteria bacterium]|nr:PAS domain-containing sensor histidine kinase [Pseudomonadota bacterium]MBI3498691.1 PAS domain-containing sensor histidine kinase [Pseudomonadota bacterium]
MEALSTMDAEDEQGSAADVVARTLDALLAVVPMPLAVFDRRRSRPVAMSPSFADAMGEASGPNLAAKAAALPGASVGIFPHPNGERWQVIALPLQGGRDTEGMLRTLFDALPALLNAKDLTSRYLFMNAFQAQLYGVAPEAAAGLTAGDLLGKSYGDYTNSLDRRVIETGRATLPYEESYADMHGTPRHFLTTKVPLPDHTGLTRGVGTISIDIAERKRLEAELVEAKLAAEDASQVKTQFLANISHELRTPLNAILGFSEIIAGEMLGPAGNPAYVAYAKDVIDAGRHLLGVINDMLDMAQIETGGLTLVEAPFDVDQAIAGAVSMISLPANAKRLDVVTTIEPGLPLIVADDRRVRQVLLNLLSNAVKYTPEGGRIEVKAGRLEDGGLGIGVADTGIGIAPEDMEDALRPFGRAQSAVALAQEGAGLGLPISKALMEAHGGRLTIDSRHGAGTTVKVEFPASRLGSGARSLSEK